uniref:CopG family transcriptional regulator n=1 Tax=Ignisphaera aggregans TaxID=334771 RepID=A0A7C4BBV2_9CREN
MGVERIAFLFCGLSTINRFIRLFRSMYFWKVLYMGGKVKTTIVIDRDLWSKFKAKLLEEGVDEVSGVIEELIKEELMLGIDSALSRLIESELIQVIEPVKPLARTSAEEVVRELRESRY